jgi:radical SAM protein with 4Fe4S-binding SPASM domain
MGGRQQRPQPDRGVTTGVGWGGRFFAQSFKLAPGRYRARVQIMFSEFARGELVTLFARSVSTSRILAEVSLPADLTNRPSSDQIYLSFSIENQGYVELSGHVAAHCETTLLRFITVLDDPDGALAPNDFFFVNPPEPSIRALKDINFGTTGICNASCVHCPTNKKSVTRMPHGIMTAQLFEKIINELADGGFTGEIHFGLFAEPLEDPILVDRMKLIKRRLPSSEISIASNAALYDPARHADIIDYVDHLGLHVEALDPDVYNRIMHPLKADRVIPKVNAIIELAQQKQRNVVSVTTPVHKDNLSQIRGLSNYFREKNVATDFTCLSSRAWEGGPYTKMSLAPNGGICMPASMVDTMFIDWDGAVVPCCFDFSKSMPLGDLNHQTMEQVFEGAAWRDMYELFRRGDWSSREACSKCRADDAGAVTSLVRSLVTSYYPGSSYYAPGKFSVTDSARLISYDAIASDRDAGDGCVIYGPYARVSPGKYMAVFEVMLLEAAPESTLLLDVCVGAHTVAGSQIESPDNGLLRAEVEFEHDSDSAVEFRIFRKGELAFEFRGATVIRM